MTSAAALCRVRPREECRESQTRKSNCPSPAVYTAGALNSAVRPAQGWKNACRLAVSTIREESFDRQKACEEHPVAMAVHSSVNCLNHASPQECFGVVWI